jgi:hypothetical protein
MLHSVIEPKSVRLILANHAVEGAFGWSLVEYKARVAFACASRPNGFWLGQIWVVSWMGGFAWLRRFMSACPPLARQLLGRLLNGWSRLARGGKQPSNQAISIGSSRPSSRRSADGLGMSAHDGAGHPLVQLEAVSTAPS